VYGLKSGTYPEEEFWEFWIWGFPLILGAFYASLGFYNRNRLIFGGKFEPGKPTINMPMPAVDPLTELLAVFLCIVIERCLIYS